MKKSKNFNFQFLIFYNFNIFTIQLDFITKIMVFRLNAFIIGFFENFKYNVGFISKQLLDIKILLKICLLI